MVRATGKLKAGDMICGIWLFVCTWCVIYVARRRELELRVHQTKTNWGRAAVTVEMGETIEVWKTFEGGKWQDFGEGYEIGKRDFGEVTD